MRDNKLPTLGKLHEEPAAPRLRDGRGTATESIELSSLFTRDVTSSGSFDLRGVEATSFGRLIQSLPVPSVVVNQSNIIVMINRAWGRTNARYQGMQGTLFSSLFPHPADAATAETLLAKVLSGRKPLVWEALLGFEGTRIWGRAHFRPIRVHEERLALVLIEDLTLQKKQLLLNKKHEEELHKAHDELEKRVEERTVELLKANQKLRREIAQRCRAESSLQESKDTIEALLNATTDLVFLVDTNGTLLALNQPCAESFGKPREELLGKQVSDLLPSYAVPKTKRLLQEVIRAGKAVRFEERIEKRIWHHSCYPVPDADGTIVSIAVFSRDVTRRKLAEQRLKLAGKILVTTNEAIVVTDVHGNITEINDAFCKITGYSREEVIGKNPRIMQSGRHPREFFDQMWKVILETGQWHGEIWDRRKNGEIYPKLLSISAVRSKQNRVTHYVGIFSDITKIKQTEQRLQYLAQYDPLTRLPNRLLFRDRLQQALLEANRNKSMVALMLLDLDRFKDINDTLGHKAGDDVLFGVAKRLTHCMRKSDTVARLGGDEFTLILPDVSDTMALAAIARKVIQSVAEPFHLPGREVFLTASVGISIFPVDGLEADRLLQNADMALYHGKELGRNTFQFFSEQMNEQVLARSALEQDLRKAVEREEFEVYYQPKLAVRTGELTGVEALIRWQHPTRGLVRPDEFVALAEDTGLIVPIGEWMLRTACRQNKTWQDMGLPPIRVAVNVSARQLQREDLAATVMKILNETGLDPTYLELELTESLAMKDADATVRVFTALKTAGIHVTIDDFGTGHSSLAYLKRLPIDKLKIDKSFIRDITPDTDDEAIVKAIIAVAHSLKLNVIAEGVETKEQLEFLQLHDCNEWQGYFFSGPQPVDALTELLRQVRTPQPG
ncbi:MAG: EAL domain-containing protein [Desulfomonile tiedjei]|nr:EAL domain-containing protein [Desulfomonile tiedjei]